LFDLDGVVIDSETQYSEYWGLQGQKYLPDRPNFRNEIKGFTLFQIFDKYLKKNHHHS